MKQLAPIFLFLFSFVGWAQDITSNDRSKNVAVSDTIVIDSVSINPARFELRSNEILIDSIKYEVDFAKSILMLKDSTLLRQDSLTINYLRYPTFLTKKYFALDENLILDSNGNSTNLYSLQQDKRSPFSPFAGLATSGSISRGVTIGNNQNAVLNSQLDLQIAGKLSDKITLRASIKDANIPLQESGYSQRLDEFDQVFIELESQNWKVRAGDVNLENSDSYFMRFTKKVQGIAITANLNHENSRTELYGSGALVRGRYTQSQFQGQEGNQGPYKLLGPNNELFILIISGSERVYVNGILLERGENNDYVIDYNAGELRFNATYPITSDMRITVEYQFTDNNYTRFIAYGGTQHTNENFKIAGYVYSENDAKNQPIQQNLSTEQVQILSDAGDDRTLMQAPSAVEAAFDENRIQYRKEMVGGEEVFVFSNNPNDELFNVRFSLVGPNLGNYIIANDVAVGNIFEYVAPILGVPQGNYEPIIQLAAPTKLQMAVVNGSYMPSEKTNMNFELALSNNDLNLFSTIDDDDNQGLAAKLNVRQRLSDKKWKIDGFADIDFVQREFRNIEGLYSIEFNRDWNLSNAANFLKQNINGTLGDQQLLKTGLHLLHPKKGNAAYTFEYLDFKDNVTGNRHVVTANLALDSLRLRTNTSLLNNETTETTSNFLRSRNRAVLKIKKKWVGAEFNIEDNQQRAIVNDSLTPLSQRFSEYLVFTGVGDSTKVFVEVGYKYRQNDSIQNNRLQRFNTSNTYYLNSRLLNNENSQLSLFASYRDFDYEAENIEDERSLNSRILYNQILFKQLMKFNMAYETNAGSLPRQEFTFVQVEPGQGAYVWIDYNNNGIQELNEFELAQFQDQAEYIRVLLPNQVFVRTFENKFSTNITWSPARWSGDKGFKKIISHFYNQTSYLIDRKVDREGNDFNLNPFSSSGNVLGLTQSVRNAIFFNRGKQHYTTQYTFLSTRAKNQLSTGAQENNLRSHQMRFTHKLNDYWLTNLETETNVNESIAENFPTRNFEIDTYSINPKISYLFNKNARFDVFYEFTDRKNQIGNLESLKQQRVGTSFSYANAQKISIIGEFNYFDNQFEGNAFSPVGYQMLEGLQAGTNFTWSLLAQKQLTKFLDLNLNYQGRKSETSKMIHTGTVQLKAYF
ncbi:hypothetical protein ACFQ1M_14485 [Sungkyunkwania multivorans]|uniref:DUF2460 domain-containing protein n=1 Tax=Sungkyunkwania multivorans TaxID=1173618 RepID=A0ABW3D2S8_9FLAO